MKNNIRKLNYLIKKGFINPCDYYVITINGSAIQLQGEFSGNLIKKLTKLKFECQVDSENGWVILNRLNIDITLT